MTDDTDTATCSNCGGESNQTEDGSPFGWTQTIYNRPADVTAIHGETVRVRWRDNGTLGFVPLDALGNACEVDNNFDRRDRNV